MTILFNLILLLATAVMPALFYLTLLSTLLFMFDNIMNRDITWPNVPEEMSSEPYDLIYKLLIDNLVQRLSATGASEVKDHPFFKDINWDTLARQKATFIPTAEALDTSYFTSRYIWNPENEHLHGGSDFDEMTDTGSHSCSNSSYNNMQDEDVLGLSFNRYSWLTTHNSFARLGAKSATGSTIIDPEN